MKYDVKWFRYPHGIEGEEMIANWREFDSFSKALAFLEKRVAVIRSINWAGGHIEDEKGNWIYDITDCGEVIDNKKSEEPQQETETAEPVERTEKSKMTPQKILQRPFDIAVHKANFVNYLEVIIDALGIVHYAVPSHQEFLIRYACKRDNITRLELESSCPCEYFCDFMKWLTLYTDCVAVWDNFVVGEQNTYQKATLKKLKLSGLYRGKIE